MMTKITKIGNLTFYGERNTWDDDSLTLTAVNGTDIVARETYYGGTVRQAINAMLRINFDIVTIHDILDGIASPVCEYENRLISGKIAGFSETEYFKRIDNTDYYKHFTHRPRM